jgi:S1-C subfamily serine protease
MPFNLLDVLILLAIIYAIIRGAKTGLSRQFFSLGGFIAGLVVGAVLAPYASKLVGDPMSKEIIIIAVVLGCTAILSGLGEYIGVILAKQEKKLHLGKVDNVLGSVFGALMVLVGAWLIAGMLIGTPYQTLNLLFSNSGIVRLLDEHLPPAPSILSRLERLVNPNGFPQVFAGLEPVPAGPIVPATPAQVASAVKADQASVVKIQGYGCGGLVSGSGFIVGPGLVMTNAHVVAGIANPIITDDYGRHTATVVEFDPSMDVAVLRANNLAGPVLQLSTKEVAAGTPAVVLGYPGGGVFTAGEAGVIDERLATGRTIYNTGITTREIYELQAVVEPGNSGGPLVLPDGTVIGIVFARSETNNNVGYALTFTEVVSRLLAAEHATEATSTGACAAE